MKKIMWGITVMFLAGMFFWFGMGDQNKNYIVKVGSTVIKPQEYRSQVSRIMNREREQAESELSETRIEDIKRQVLSSLITQEMMLQEAKRLTVKSVNEEVVNTVKSMPQFQSEGEFNLDLYKLAIKQSMNMTPDEFEKLLEKDIITRKLERMILASVQTTKLELQLAYLLSNGSMDGYQGEAMEIRNTVLQEKRIALYQNWMRSLQEKQKIEVNTELLGLN